MAVIEAVSGKPIDRRSGDPSTTIDSGNHHRLSVIVRSHSEARLRHLDDALFSLAIQDYDEIEVVIALQSPTRQHLENVQQAAKKQPWSSEARVLIVPVYLPQSIDGRTHLMNAGIEAATGRFLAFLDDDDVVYQSIYATLIGRLHDSEAGVAVGGVRRAELGVDGVANYVKSKSVFSCISPSPIELIYSNFIPIHSYVVDRSRFAPQSVRFNLDFTILEDYVFLLSLLEQQDFDFSAFDMPLCEYRFYSNGMNSSPGVGNCPHVEAAKHEKWEAARRKLAAARRRMLFRVDGQQLSEWLDRERRVQAQLAVRIKAHEEQMLRVSHRVIAALNRYADRFSPLRIIWKVAGSFVRWADRLRVKLRRLGTRQVATELFSALVRTR